VPGCCSPRYTAIAIGRGGYIPSRPGKAGLKRANEREREREREEQEEEGPLSRPDERHPTSEPQIAPLSTKREMNFRTSKHKSVYPLRVVIVNKKVVESRRRSNNSLDFGASLWSSL